MKNGFGAVVLVALIAGLSMFVAAQKVTEIADLDGMAGCWEQKNEAKKLLITEMWMKPAGTSIFGTGRTVRNGKTVDFEFMRIEQRPDGIYFVAQPKANAVETPFKLIRSTLNEVVFENKAHDFPQRVIYRFNGTTMTGLIEGDQNGKFVGIDFPMNRVSCT